MSIRKVEHYLQKLNAFVHINQHVSRWRGAAEANNGVSERREGKKSIVDREIIAVKDNICAVDQPTTCASEILKGYVSPYAATVVQKLQAAGATIAGKTNMDEFGMGSHSTHSTFGPVYQSKRARSKISAGGSSGGSAVAVAMYECLAALGTDTGGSVRLPAAYTGICGFKPSYGLISRHGVVTYANSLDTVGIMAKEVPLVEGIFNLIQDHDSRDPTSLSPLARQRIENVLDKRLKRQNLRIGIPLEYNVTELDEKVRNVWIRVCSALVKNGHIVTHVSLPTTKLALSAYYILAPAEASSNLAKYDGVRYGNPSSAPRDSGDVLFSTTRGEGLGEEVRRRILLGSFTLSASAIENYFIKAQRVRRLVQKDFDRVFALPNPLLEYEDSVREAPSAGGVDVLLLPTAPSLPPRIEDLSARTALDSYRDDVFTVPSSLAGLPAMSVPARQILRGDQNGGVRKSVGLQVIGQYGDDHMVIQTAKILTGW